MFSSIALYKVVTMYYIIIVVTIVHDTIQCIIRCIKRHN